MASKTADVQVIGIAAPSPVGGRGLETYRLVRIDIKEFFVCGGLRELAEEALKAFDEDESSKKVVMKEVVDVLLVSQFVRSEAANLMYEVVEGSGMGLPHSAGYCGFGILSQSRKRNGGEGCPGKCWY